jgi:hypothetical protein
MLENGHCYFVMRFRDYRRECRRSFTIARLVTSASDDKAKFGLQMLSKCAESCRQML